MIIVFLACFLFFIILASQGKNYAAKDLSYGVTFSQKHADWLLPGRWRETYTAILDDLQARKLRLPAYWDVIQKDGATAYDYKDFDWQIEEAGKRDAEIIVAVGYRLPRWPECHLPAWTKNLSADKKEQAALDYIRTTINRYKDKKQIIAWQIENEPFLPGFGECPKFNKKFLDQEIALAKKLDSARPIVVTDSGELSFWVAPARRADIFGTSLYLNTYSQNIKSYITYPIAPGFFHFKKNLVSLFAHPQKWIVIEMQAEPWGPVSYVEMSEKEKARTMDLKKFRQILNFGQKAGFQEFYLWGTEWWYWEKEAKNNPIFWEEAKKLFSK